MSVMSPDLGLVSLLIQLFERGGLLRFARATFGGRFAYEIDPKAPVTLQAERLVPLLRQEGLVSPRLFDALLEWWPQQREAIEAVRAEVLVDEEAALPETTAPEGGDAPVSDERAAWRARLKKRIASVSAPRDPPRAWIEAAAVLPSYSVLGLKPVGSSEERVPRDLAEQLAAVSDVLPDGSLSLHLETRQEALAGLVEDGRVIEALDANPEASEASVHSRMLRLVAGRWGLHPQGFGSHEEIAAAYDVVGWLATSGVVSTEDRDRLARYLERSRHIDPLRRLRGRHFRGRADERSRLKRHLEARDDHQVLALWGVGGVGKSALLSAVLLELEEARSPWVYIDFDNPASDPARPRKIVESIARQLALFFENGALGSSLTAIESAAAGDAHAFAFELDQAADIEGLLKGIGDRLLDFVASASFALVFDTFEQVQVRGARVSDVVYDLVQTIRATLPQVRIVVSGRGSPRWKDVEEIELGDLDPESAKAVLEALGVEDPTLRELSIERVGTSPLGLRLAADAIVAGQLDASDMEALVVQVGELERQGQLYTRILGHIRDREVRKLAHPGLVARRLTDALIREVLADVCGISSDRAAELFERLPTHVSLFEEDDATPEEGKALRHRQDVRQKMLRLMVSDSEWDATVREIHERTASFYSARTDEIARAEEIYHRLYLQEPPESFDHRWGPELATSLARSWEEPLPESARAWLGPRIGRGDGDRALWRDLEWEIHAAREARERLATGDPQGALTILAERTSRRPGSNLFALEIEALRAVGEHRRALAVIDDALADAVDGGRVGALVRLHLSGAEVALEAGEEGAFARHQARALETAERMGDAHGTARALELGVRYSRSKGSDDASTRQALVDAFVTIEDATLRRDPELGRRLLVDFGVESAPVLRKAAKAFGNRSGQTWIRRDSFELADLLRELEGTEGGRQQLDRLAQQMGLPSKGYEIQDLARQAVRYDRLGDALLAVLEHSGGDERLRAGALKLFSHEALDPDR